MTPQTTSLRRDSLLSLTTSQHELLSAHVSHRSIRWEYYSFISRNTNIYHHYDVKIFRREHSSEDILLM